MDDRDKGLNLGLLLGGVQDKIRRDKRRGNEISFKVGNEIWAKAGSHIWAKS